ncbi:hypothetical protein UFOVP694_65 [uncultured Caudovirales phage]|jgi:hypothetical protein|uniref:Uncharacterized protein n=1 Tax=uncultured Caudovirales phage TaxID=2100421 RepID=A0A6J5NE35_9CAUD|nr:hypothetical protein UFOVP694_65 [uncultured Caudovirales phage]
MTCSSCSPQIQKYGADPASVQWKVVRGDTASLEVEFLEIDEITPFDTDGWTYKATSYDATGSILDDLPVTATTGVAVITVDPCITEKWGTAYKTVVAELPFDLQITIPAVTGEPTVWTPVIGTICVLGDITPGGSL